MSKTKYHGIAFVLRDRKTGEVRACDALNRLFLSATKDHDAITCGSYPMDLTESYAETNRPGRLELDTLVAVFENVPLEDPQTDPMTLFIFLAQAIIKQEEDLRASVIHVDFGDLPKVQAPEIKVDREHKPKAPKLTAV